MPSKKTRARSSLADDVRFSRNYNQLTGLPAKAWKGLCLIAWMRLEQINHRWAQHIFYEFWSFHLTWLLTNGDDEWMRAAFQYMLRNPLKKGQKPHPRSLLEDYKKIRRV